jgi:hypothetical protein
MNPSTFTFTVFKSTLDSVAAFACPTLSRRTIVSGPSSLERIKPIQPSRKQSQAPAFPAQLAGQRLTDSRQRSLSSEAEFIILNLALRPLLQTTHNRNPVPRTTVLGMMSLQRLARLDTRVFRVLNKQFRLIQALLR